METLSAQWFIFYYLLLGFLILISGLYLIGYDLKVRDYLVQQAQEQTPPDLLRTILKYLFLFTIPCLVFSFFPFSWVELLFSFWSLFIVYIAGIQLVRWENTRLLIRDRPDRLQFFIRMTGAIMVAVSLVIFSLSYLIII